MRPRAPSQAEPHHTATQPCTPDARKFVLMTAILASALGFIDSTIVAIALPKIRESLDASFTQIQWVGSGYVLFLAALMLLGGAAGDRWGVRRVFAAGIMGFVVTSLACAIAPDAATLIAARCAKGAAAAIMVPASLAIIAKNYPRAERGRAIGLWVAASSVTTALGPALGGWLLASGGPDVWRWVFGINLPLGALALWMLLAKVPADAGDSSHPLDYAGAILTTAALTALALGLTLLGGTGEGLAAYTAPVGGAWGVLVFAALLMVAALCVEHRKTDPMIELSLFRSRAFSGANAATLLIYTALGATLFFLPMLLIGGWGMSETYAGGIFLPFSLLIAGLSPLVGRYADSNGLRLPLTFGPLLTAAGVAWLGWSAFGQDYWWGVVPAVLLIGSGMGITVSPLSTAVMQSVEDRQTGQASGINNMVARMANLVAIAGFGALVAVLFARFVEASDLPRDLSSRLIDAGFGERLTGALYQVGVAEVQSAAMNSAFAWMCFATAAICVVAGAIGWVTQRNEA